MFERRHAVTIRYLPCSGIDQNADDLLINWPAIADDHGLHHRRPSKVVDVIDVDAGLDENSHRRGMALVRRRD